MQFPDQSLFSFGAPSVSQYFIKTSSLLQAHVHSSHSPQEACTLAPSLCMCYTHTHTHTHTHTNTHTQPDPDHPSWFMILSCPVWLKIIVFRSQNLWIPGKDALKHQKDDTHKCTHKHTSTRLSELFQEILIYKNLSSCDFSLPPCTI